MKAHVIIGANFGDEGKGMTTDYLCRKLSQCIVIRFNGGAQAGHTVVTPSGERKVFSHLGSGTFTGTPTYLSQFFIANPVAYLKELNDFIDQLDTRPLVESIVHIHPDAPVTTPFDIMFNWALENSRKVNHEHHGSCGLGINETVTRHNYPGFSLSVNDLRDKSRTYLFNILKSIRDDYYFRKINSSSNIRDFLDPDWNNDNVIENFLNQCHDFIGFVRVSDYHMLTQYNHLIFEGAQGLLLDEDHYWFPHVTRSKTGLPNVEFICKRIGVSELDVYYITRSYLTRHGNGPLPFEVSGKIYDCIEDPTNITNHFQGSLRFAPLNIDLLKESIQDDMHLATLSINPKLVVTCVNQLPKQCKYILNDEEHHGTPETMLNILYETDLWNGVVISTSPTYEHFSIYKPG